MYRTKRFFTLILAVLTAACLLSPPAALAVEPEADFEGYLVRLSDTAVQNSLTLLDTGGSREVSDGLYLVEDLETAQAMDRLGLVDYYEPNYRLELLDNGTDYTTTQWNLLAVHAQAAWDHTGASGSYDTRGDEVTVAVIDSGVYAEHPDFQQDNLLPCHNVTGSDAAYDGWHGTFVTGVIAAQVGNSLGVDGAAPNVTILPICVTRSGNAYTSWLIDALDYAVEQGVDVINLSIGGTNYSLAMEEACRRALDAGIILVAAAGNYRSGQTQSSSTYMYPASFDGVVSVSACRQDGTGVVFDDSYSFFNDQVTVSAPGTAVQSLYTDGGTYTNSGTSFAAPVVTAMSAMAKQRCPDMTPEAFTQLLCATAADLGEEGYDIYYGHGLADIAAFVEALDQTYSAVCWFAQYDSNGRMLAVDRLPDGAEGPDQAEILPEAVVGKLFRLDSSGVPLEAARTFSLAPEG